MKLTDALHCLVMGVILGFLLFCSWRGLKGEMEAKENTDRCPTCHQAIQTLSLP